MEGVAVFGDELGAFFLFRFFFGHVCFNP
jgi:hypothetical protein